MQPNIAPALGERVAVWVALVLLAGCGSASPPVADHRSDAGDVTVVVPMTGAAAREQRPVVRALRILRGWDERRAAAYAAAEPAALRRLYVPGSRAGARDVRVLRAYAARGLVVEGLTMQVLRARLVSATPTLLRLRVIDRVAGGLVVARGSDRTRARLPTGRAVVRVVTLVDRGPRWVVRAVRRP